MVDSSRRGLYKPYIRYRKKGIQQRASQIAYFPTQLAGLYNYPTLTNGSSASIAIGELGGGFPLSDIPLAFNAMGLPSPRVVVHSVRGAQNSPGDPNGADGEVALDYQVCGGMTGGLVDLHIYFAPNDENAIADLIDAASSDGHDAFSLSWGSPERYNSAASLSRLEASASKAAGKGMTITASAGDNGSSDGAPGQNVDSPGSSPWILSCGGTTYPASGPEYVWNDGPSGGATGGGPSSLYPRPDYQSEIGLSGNSRCAPDVAGNADPETGWITVDDGQSGVIGGTSAVSPMWAALVACLNIRLGKKLGFINPLLYKLPQGIMRDVTRGSNGAYSARPGYDMCTGVGTPDGLKLLSTLSGVVTPTPPTNPPTQSPVSNPALLEIFDGSGNVLSKWKPY